MPSLATSHAALTLAIIILCGGCRCPATAPGDTPAGAPGSPTKRRARSTDDRATGAAADRRGHIYVVGSSGENSCVVVKCDRRGKVLWQRPLEEKKLTCASVVAARDGGVLVAGSFRREASRGRETGVVVAKFDADGTARWKKVFAQSVGTFTVARLLAAPGHTLIAATGPGGHHVRAMSDSGAVVWEKKFKKKNFYIRDAALFGAHSLKAAGRFFGTGAAEAESKGAEDIAVATFDLKRGTVSRNVVGSEDVEFASAVVPAGDHLITGGFRRGPGEHRARPYIVKTDARDAVVWERLIDLEGDFVTTGMAPLEGGRLLLVGNATKRRLLKHARPGAERIMDRALSKKMGMFLILDTAGNVARRKTLDLGPGTSIAAAASMPDGKILLVGKVHSRRQVTAIVLVPNHDMLLVLIDGQGKIAWKRIIESAQLERGTKRGGGTGS